MEDRGFYKGMLIGINIVLRGQIDMYMNSGRFNSEGELLIKLYKTIDEQLRKDVE